MRELRVVDSSDVPGVMVALRDALSGDGAAILPHQGRPDSVPDQVERRVALVVETSGSTGRPKRVMISTDALLAAAAAIDVQLGGPGQWMLALPTHYIAGAAVLVRSLAADIPPVVLPPEHSTGNDFIHAAESMGAARRYISLVPTQLSRLVSHPETHDALRRFNRILLGGQAASAALLDRAGELGLSVTRTYGSSETGGGCVWDGRAIGDTRVRIVDGRVELATASLAEGYLDDLERTETAFVTEAGCRWYRTDDTGMMVDGTLTVTGRIDDVIVSGGVKVSLGEVETVVRGIPGLEDAIVVVASHEQWGQTPVVVRPAPAGDSDTRVELQLIRDAVAAALGRAAVPSRLEVVEAIPLTASGKPDRVAVTRSIRAD